MRGEGAERWRKEGRCLREMREAVARVPFLQGRWPTFRYRAYVPNES